MRNYFKPSILKKIFAAFLFLNIFISIPVYATQSFPDKPEKTDFFVDQANLIQGNEAKQINEIASKLLGEERIPIFVVTITSLKSMNAGHMSIEEYAESLFNHWGIGFQDRNNGILLLVSHLDRKARIELGADWGLTYNRDAEEIMNSLIIPDFKERNFSLGILAGVKGLDALARGLQLPKPESPWWVLPLIIAVFGGLIFLIINLFKKGKKGWAWALIGFLGILIFFLIKAAASSGGSGGGFGGGSSGGGGATGSW